MVDLCWHISLRDRVGSFLLIVSLRFLTKDECAFFTISLLAVMVLGASDLTFNHNKALSSGAA